MCKKFVPTLKSISDDIWERCQRMWRLGECHLEVVWFQSNPKAILVFLSNMLRRYLVKQVSAFTTTCCGLTTKTDFPGVSQS